jgi:hypothetical protein
MQTYANLNKISGLLFPTPSKIFRPSSLKKFAAEEKSMAAVTNLKKIQETICIFKTV